MTKQLFSPGRVKENMAYLSRNNFILYSLLQKIAYFESLSEDELLLLQQQKASAMVSYARKYSSFYRSLYRSNAVLSSFEQDFFSLPVVTRKNVIDHLKSIGTASSFFLKTAQTSGTSGTPLSVYRSPGSILKENAYVWRFRMHHGVMPGDPVVSLRPMLDRNKIFQYNKSENKLYLSCYALSASNMGLYAKLITCFRPKAIFSLPSSAFTLANLLQLSDISIEVPAIFTSSETLYPFQREKIEKVMNTKVLDWYGNVERTIAMGQCKYGNYHEMPMYSFNEYRQNSVITTSLINRAFPLIRYEVDDSFIHLTQSCRCGKSKGVSSIEGRYEDAVVSPDGTHVTALGMALRGIPHLLYAQIIQEELQSIQVNLVTTVLFKEKEEGLLLLNLRKRLPSSIDIRLNYIDEEGIIKTSAGKFTLIISRLKQECRIIKDWQARIA